MTRDSYFPHLSQRQIIDESAVSEKDSQFQGLSRKKQTRFVDSVVVSSLAEEEEDLIQFEERRLSKISSVNHTMVQEFLSPTSANTRLH